ncbi:hypothetical protein [Streptomyces purpurascens]
MAFDGLQGRGLAGPVRAEQRVELPLPHLERQVLHGVEVAVAEVEAFNVDDWCRGHVSISAVFTLVRQCRGVIVAA